MKRFEDIYDEIVNGWLDSQPIKIVMEKIKASNKNAIVLYGAVSLARVFMDAFIELGISILGVCDKNAKGQLEGIDIFTPEILIKEYGAELVLVCSHSYNVQICDELIKNGFNEDQIVSCPTKYPYFESPKSFEKYIEGYKWAYNFYEDELSKKLVVDRMRLYLLDEELVPNSDSGCYYEEGVIILKDDEVYVDGGAFNGNSTIEFINKTNGKYKHVFCLEPSGVNYQNTIQRLEQYSNVDVINKGLWNDDAVLQFHFDATNPAGSFLVNVTTRNINDENTIPVTSIDSLANEKIYIQHILKWILKVQKKKHC